MARTVTDRDVQSKRQKFKTFRRNEKGLIHQMTRFDKFRVFSSQQMHFQHLSRNSTSIKRVGQAEPFPPNNVPNFSRKAWEHGPTNEYPHPPRLQLCPDEVDSSFIWRARDHFACLGRGPSPFWTEHGESIGKDNRERKLSSVARYSSEPGPKLYSLMAAAYWRGFFRFWVSSTWSSSTSTI